MGDTRYLRSEAKTWGDETATYYWHNHDDEYSVSETILFAVSEFTGTEIYELSPLGEWIDADALNSLFGSGGPRTPSMHDGELTFAYEDVTVTVDTIGRIIVVDRSS
jgi:hypothetical protein